MTRKKVKLAFIVNDTARKATYKKRRNGVLKKANELTTLCGIDACLIIYSPHDSQPEIWPSTMEVQSALMKFRQKPELEQYKKMLDQVSFMKQRIMKVSEQVKKMKKNNREKEMALIMYQYLSTGITLHNMSVRDLNDLTWLIEQNVKDISRKMESLDLEPQNQIQIRSQGQPQVGEDHNGKGTMEMDLVALQRQQNFMELMNCAGDEALPFGDFNLQIATWPSPCFP